MIVATLNRAAGSTPCPAAWTGTVLPCPVPVPPPAPHPVTGREASTSQTRWGACPRTDYQTYGAGPSSVRIGPVGGQGRSATADQTSPSPGGRGLVWSAGSPAVHELWGACTAGHQTGASSPCGAPHASVRSPQADHSADASPPAISPAGGPETPAGYARARRGHRVADRSTRRGPDDWEGFRAATLLQEGGRR